MKLTPEREQMIIDAITEHPDDELILPDSAYVAGSDRVIVTVDGLPVDLARHLHNKLIRPLRVDERMWQIAKDPRNVNPHLFAVIAGKKNPPGSVCRNGHPYQGNEAPPNGYGYRCATCLAELRERRREGRGTANRDKTHCPRGHEYTPENTIREKTGRRRCRTCNRAKNRAHWERTHRKDPES